MEKDHILSSLSIRPLHSIEELKMVRDLEALVWAMDDPVPVHQTATAVKHGGMVLGAFVGDQLVGFQYSFAGFDGKKTYLCSHVLGVHPDFRISGIGEKLKLAQRIEAIRKGYDLIIWTYDPLETVNGYLNIKKLGAICSTYIENCYGDMTDILNTGVPSDRFMVEWWIQSDRVVKNLEQVRNDRSSLEHAQHVLRTETDERGIPFPADIDLSLVHHHAELVVPVPAQFQEIKQRDLDAAIRWRMQTRAVFSHYFRHGWQVVDFVKSEVTDHHRVDTIHFYIMQRK